MKQAKSFANLLFCIYLALAFCFVENSFSQTLTFKSYTTSDGLAHDRVNRIVRDSRGFVWFCTSEGLSRFDGSGFKNYTQDDGLPHRAINDLLETKSGKYWIATRDGLVLFDPLGVSKRELKGDADPDKPMFSVMRPADLPTGSETWEAEVLLEDRNGQIWVGSSRGIYQLVSKEDRHLRRFDMPAESDGREPRFANLLQDRRGAIWAGSETMLFRILPDLSGVQTMAKMGVESFLEDKDGRIWVGAGGIYTGLHLFSYVGDEAVETRVFGKRDGLTSDYWINALYGTSDGRIFIGVGEGFCEYSPNDDPSQPQFRVFSKEGVVALGDDSNGNIWFSTGSSGIRRMGQHGFINFDTSDGLSTTNIGSIISTYDGTTYVLSAGFKIDRYNGKGFDSVAPPGMIGGNWGTGQITFPDRTGAWWVTGAGGLQRYPAVKRFEDLAAAKPIKTYTTNDGLTANDIFQIFEDSRGKIWFSTNGEAVDTLHLWDPQTETIKVYTTTDGLPAKNFATAFGEDLAGNVWIGFYKGGLIRYHNGKFESYTTADALPPGYIANIFTDSAGRIWVATSSGGVVRIDEPASEDKPRLANLTTRDGLSSNQATCTTQDNFGRIYISTGRGVNRLDLPTGRIKIFTKADGLPENIVRLCKRDAEGSLWFGTSHGLVRYSPVADERSEPPPIFLSGVKVNGEPVKKLSELGESNVAGVELAADQRQVQIDYFALGFGTGEALRYQYKLAGVDPDWSEATEQRTVNLNLSAGQYHFLVRAVNSDGAVSIDPAAVTFTIARPVWQRWWFLLLMVAAIIGLIYLAYTYRLKRLVELEKVRTRIATDLHDDIGASLSKIAILSEVVHQRIAPSYADNVEIDRPLKEIAGTSRDLVDSMSDIVWAIDPDRDHLHDLVQRMRILAGEMTELAEIGMHFASPGIESIGEMSIGADMRREIYLIFKETINNLVKHSACTFVRIEVRHEDDHLIVSVNDDGKGFDISAAADGAETSLGGNGLPNMRKRAANLDGRYEIVSVIGEGTSVTLYIPLRLGYRGFSRRGA